VTCVRDDEVAALVEVVVPKDARSDLRPDDLSVRAATTSSAGALLEYHFMERFVADWLPLLAERGIPAVAVREDSWLNRDAFLDAEMLASGRVMGFEHPIHGGIRVVGDLLRFTDQSTARRGRAPLLGEHTAEVLTELGFDGAHVTRLRASGACR
jgi:crotonobetainyl-CoA:carnitine CoA-transferase CaiB-like acyl-CoA transferase